jgi:DNA-directed RNA polymerase subunit RPC12/RpoP
MVMVSIKCPECGKDIGLELPEKKSLVIKKCPECGKEICGPDGCCITVCKSPHKED